MFIEQRRGVAQSVSRGPVGKDHLGFKTANVFAISSGALHGELVRGDLKAVAQAAELRQLIRRSGQGDVCALRQAEIFLSGAVAGDDTTVAVMCDQDWDGQSIENSLQLMGAGPFALLTGAQYVLGALTIGDVSDDGLQTSVGQRASHDLAGKERAILALEFPIAGKDSAAAKTLRLVRNALEFVGCNHVADGELQKFFAGVAQHLGPGGIHIEVPALRTGQENTVRRLFDQEPEVFFALAQGRLGAGASFLQQHFPSHVALYAPGANQHSIFDDAGHIVAEYLPIPEQVGLVRLPVADAKSGADKLPGHFQIARIVEVQRFAQALPNQFLSALVAVHAGKRVAALSQIPESRRMR